MTIERVKLQFSMSPEPDGVLWPKEPHNFTCDQHIGPHRCGVRAAWRVCYQDVVVLKCHRHAAEHMAECLRAGRDEHGLWLFDLIWDQKPEKPENAA